MSYEGYSQFLCKKGHQWCEDCYQASPDSKCPICLTPFVWENMVDETNGSHEELNGEMIRIDGYIELEPKEKKCCSKCHSCLEITYKIPKKVE